MVVFLQSRQGLAVSAALALLSILVRWMVSRRYSRIAGQAERMDTTKDKTLKNWKKQFEELAGIRKGVTNIPGFVDKCLKRYRRWGITLRKWNSAANGLALLSMFSGVLLAFGAYWYDLDYRLLILYGSGGVIFGGIAVLTGNVLDPAGRKELARLALLDYFENTLLPDLEGRPGRSRRKVQPLQSPKLTLEPEEEAVLKDVFSEYLT